MAAPHAARREETFGTRASRITLAALGAGQLAGLIFLIVLIIALPLFAGRPPLFGLRVIGSLPFGHAAIEHGGWQAILAAFCMNQLGPALFWSLAFAFCAAFLPGELTLNDSMMLGFLVGIIAEMVDVYAVLPPLFHAVHGVDYWANEMPKLWNWVAHACYGLSLGALYYALRRAMGAELPVPLPAERDEDFD